MARSEFSVSYAEQLIEGGRRYLLREILVPEMAIEASLLLATFVAAYLVAQPLRRRVLYFFTTRVRDYRAKRFGKTLVELQMPFVWAALMIAALYVLDWLGYPHDILRALSGLLIAWIVIRLFTSLVPNPFWSRTVAVIAWTLAALNILGLLAPTILLLDSFGLTLGETRLTAFVVIKAILIGGGLLWAATLVSTLLQKRIQKVTNLTPSVRALIIQVSRFLLILLAILIALNTVGIDLTALAVFSGALGVGIGFGLQKVVSNFISGIILLLDRSIRPGDVIEIEGTYGAVANLGARYTSIVTRDGTEYLIPNEQLITEQVINWAYSDTKVRRKVDVGIAYSSDVELARQLIIEACAETERVLDTPKPVCHLVEFGDNSVNLQARFWIADPENGVINVTSAVMLRIWHKFHDAGIEFPFPQRDIHVKSDEPLQIMVAERPAPRRKAAPRRAKTAIPETMPETE